nr:MAG TPA: hypothetical protein [Caudoviricetes sp.]
MTSKISRVQNLYFFATFCHLVTKVALLLYGQMKALYLPLIIASDEAERERGEKS